MRQKENTTAVALDLPTIPLITARFRGDATAELSVDGQREQFAADSVEEVRDSVLARVTAVAADLGRPVQLTAEDDDGAWLLAVHPDGEIGEEEPLDAELSEADDVPSPMPAQGAMPTLGPALAHGAAPAHGAHAAGAPPTVEAPQRASFLQEQPRTDRAARGWRGVLVRVGLPVAASRSEREEREEVQAVSRHWAGPRTISIVNGKGGANKTPTTAMLAAVFARNGGSGVLAWDNNETRGTLGWRTEQAQHAATLQTLLPTVDHLLSPAAQSSELGYFVHHQTGDKYDVLRSNPAMLATEQRIATEDFDRLHAVAAKYFRLVFIDSGNDESAERWLRMIDHTDQLVIATTALGEHAEAGALLLEALAQRDERSARLARDAVVVVSQSERTGKRTDARTVAAGFEPIARRAVTIPFDPALHGGRLDFASLAKPTRRAWLHAAAAVADGL